MNIGEGKGGATLVRWMGNDVLSIIRYLGIIVDGLVVFSSSSGIKMIT